MDCKFVLTADTGNLSREGKLNIAGEFNAIFAATTPVAWPLFSVVARFEANISEGVAHSLQLKITDDDGKAILASPIVPLQFGKAASGMPIRADLVAPVVGLVFPAFGDYAVNLFVDGVLRGATTLYVKRLEDAATRGERGQGD